VGTTDLDHDRALDDEPRISPQEVAYLIAAVRYQFPSTRIESDDAIATYAGVRPVIDAGASDPSRASRDHAVWNERGLISITGGKMTTFRPMAMDALAAAAPHLPAFDRTPRPVFSRAPLPPGAGLSGIARQRLAGRYGALAAELVEDAAPGELEAVDGTTILWAELRWAAAHEAVVRLDDLLLRRTRLGLLTADGGERHFARVGEICRPLLDWDLTRWNAELEAYRARWDECYRVPARSLIPDWRELL
jgi:glycerol-3-phosphate dehydrogenase